MSFYNAKKLKIYSQLSSDLQMINLGYSKDSSITEDEGFAWHKEIDNERYPDIGYSIEIRAKFDENGLVKISPTIWYENLRVEMQSFVDVDIYDIENLAQDLLNTMMKHNFV